LKIGRLLPLPFFTSTSDKSNILDLYSSRYDLSFKLKNPKKKFCGGRLGRPSGGLSFNHSSTKDGDCLPLFILNEISLTCRKHEKIVHDSVVQDSHSQ
jgi:hypothetical protein